MEGAGVLFYRSQTVKQELQALLNLGVIDTSHSDWRSLIVVVPKWDGSMGVCIDFWKVNAMSKFDMYLMLWVDEFLN